MLSGVFQILFGLMGMGRLIRFVSYSVMNGFLTGVALLLILNQLPTVTGIPTSGGNRLIQTADLIRNLDQAHSMSLVVSLLSLGLAISLSRTRLASFGSLIAIIVPSALVAAVGTGSVQVVSEVGRFPQGIPSPFFPSLSQITPDLITGAFALSAIILVQGAGVSQSVPNPNGSRRSSSRDFIAQGMANIVSGAFRGIPVGGSFNETALNVMSGGRRRWAAIFAGIFLGIIVLALPGLLAHVATPALGALLILAGVQNIRFSNLHLIWSSGWPSSLASVVTFLSTLLLPIQAAIAVGMILSATLYVYKSASDISVVELVERPDGRIEERSPPKQLKGGRATVIEVHGDLFFAGARTLERLLPAPEKDRNPVVILRLRGHAIFGATLIEVFSNYVDQLRRVDGRLYLTGLSQRAYAHLRASGRFQLKGPIRAYEATPILGESTRNALADAEAWLISLGTDVRT
jgi:SulP family sulfate permease